MDQALLTDIVNEFFEKDMKNICEEVEGLFGQIDHEIGRLIKSSGILECKGESVYDTDIGIDGCRYNKITKLWECNLLIRPSVIFLANENLTNIALCKRFTKSSRTTNHSYNTSQCLKLYVELSCNYFDSLVQKAREEFKKRVTAKLHEIKEKLNNVQSDPTVLNLIREYKELILENEQILDNL